MTTLTPDARISVLNKIYAIHEDYAKNRTVACEAGCASCCTTNVTITTLEGCRIIRHLSIEKRLEDLLEKIRPTVPEKGQPMITTNQLASFLARGEAPPEAEEPVAKSRCPFLENELCAIYSVRPFGCRCFLSEKRCRDVGLAELSPALVTANTVFLQFIEHVDVGGFFGNLLDVLLFLGKAQNLQAYLESGPLEAPNGLHVNHPIPLLLIPPEHREHMKGVLARLQSIRVPTG